MQIIGLNELSWIHRAINLKYYEKKSSVGGFGLGVMGLNRFYVSWLAKCKYDAQNALTSQNFPKILNFQYLRDKGFRVNDLRNSENVSFQILGNFSFAIILLKRSVKIGANTGKTS